MLPLVQWNRKEVIAMAAVQSGDIVYCLKTSNPNRPLVLTCHADGSLTVDCLFLKCPFFDKCKLSKNPVVQDFLMRSAL